MAFLTLARGLGRVAYFNIPPTDLFDDKLCCWIVVFTFTATLGADLGNDAVIFQEEMQEVSSPSPFIPHKAAHKSYHRGLSPRVLETCGQPWWALSQLNAISASSPVTFSYTETLGTF